MKPSIHPEYFQAKVTCACGSNFVVGSTLKEIRVELCNQCHPFYTGKQKFVDTARRVEKFQEKATRVAAAAGVRKGKKVKQAAQAAKKAEKAEKKTSSEQ
jgi:large subunit ribosomal protein L31